MKNYAALIMIVLGIFLASQVSAQIDSKTKTSGTTTEKTTNTGTDKTAPAVKSSKEKPGSTTTGQQTAPVTGTKALKTGKMFDATGNLIYSYDEMGYIRNAKNRVFCQLTAKGEIVRKRVVVGTVKNGIFQDKTGKEYARIVQDGKVVDGNSKSVGTINNDGTVTDKNGTKLGSAPGVDKNVIVIIYFYKDLIDPKTGKSSVK
jgi:hypothetical protein